MSFEGLRIKGDLRAIGRYFFFQSPGGKRSVLKSSSQISSAKCRQVHHALHDHKFRRADSRIFRQPNFKRSAALKRAVKASSRSTRPA